MVKWPKNILNSCFILYAANIYLFKVNNKYIRKRCKRFSQLRMKLPKWRHWHRYGVVVIFEHISHLLLVFLLLILNMYFFAGLELLRNTLGWIIQSKTSIGIQLLHFFLQVSFQKSLKHAQPHLIAILKIYTLTKIYHSEIYHSDGEENMAVMVRKIWKNNTKTNKNLLGTYR